MQLNQRPTNLALSRLLPLNFPANSKILWPSSFPVRNGDGPKPWTPPRARAVGALRASPQELESSNAPTTRNANPVILWYKHDLRVDDHPGLHLALAMEGVEVIPYFCFDPARYARLAHNTSSAAALRQAVHSLSSDLAAKLGFRGGLRVESGSSWEESLVKLIRQTGATKIITEQEIETYPWVQGVEAVRAALAKESLPCDIITWNAPLFTDITTENGTANDDVAITFEAWKRRQTHVCQPLDVPSSLVAADRGEGLRDELPEAEELKRLSMDACLKSIQFPEFAESIFSTGQDYATEAESEEVDENDAQALVRQAFDVHLTPDGEWEAELAAELAAGEGPVINALKSYLEHVETCADGGGDSRNDWEWKLGKVIARYDVPAAPDGCFPALFTKAFSLGVVSRRRAYTEALKRLQDGGQESVGDQQQADVNLGSGVFGLLGWLLTSNGGALARRRKLRKGLAVVAAAEAGEFHAALASDKEMLKHMRVTKDLQLGHWRWRGLLAEYLYCGPELANNGTEKYPKGGEKNVAVLLVHGFGAFAGHWRDNIDAFARQGYEVYAVTLPGYGRSEKPSMPYDQDMWRDYLADFVRYVIRKPVVAVGNSIGGFLVASLAADVPKAVVGLILVNSAGLLKENYQRDPKPPPAHGKPKKPSPPRFIVEGVSRALFAFLQGDVTNQLKRVYPVAPDRADAWLGQEISRASGDPGALGVFRSVFYLPKPRPLNFLVSDCFGGPTLVVQGVKDPLNDARKRAKELGRLCDNVRVETVNAGHCPHDEIPDVFNALVLEFMEEHVVPAFLQKDRNVSIESRKVSSGS